MSDQTDVVYAVPPMLSIGVPVYGVSLLCSCLKESGISCKIDFANAYFADAAQDELDAITSLELFHPLVEYLFNKPAGIENDVTIDEAISAHISVRCIDYPHEAERFNSPEYRELLRTAVVRGLEIAEAETDRTARRVLALNPKVVGCSASFTQRNAALAILKRVKELAPQVITVMGGYHTSGQGGLAILRCFKYVDCAFFGESDDIVAEAMRKLMTGDTDNMPYGVVINSDNLPSEAPHRIVEDMDSIPLPDYDDYITLINSPMGQRLVGEKNKNNIHVALEASRGCWWGCKNPCTFCGVCGKTQTYRCKSPERVANQLVQLKQRYDIDIVDFTDAIMPLHKADQIIDAIKDTGESFRLYTEVKSNIKKDQIQRLADVGYISLQPGIESLSDSFLKLINKGVSAIQNVSFIKNSTQLMYMTTWNILCGAPGETDEQYEEQIALIPKLMHLTPPGGMSSIWYSRDSVYHKNQEAYGLDLVPMDETRVFCPDDEDFILDTAVYFKDLNASPVSKHRQQLIKELRALCNQWNDLESYRRTRLDMAQGEDSIMIADTRKCRTKFIHRLQGIQREIYLEADQPVSMEQLVNNLSDWYDYQEITAAIESLLSNNLMIHLSGQYLALALPMDFTKFTFKYLLFAASAKK